MDSSKDDAYHGTIFCGPNFTAWHKSLLTQAREKKVDAVLGKKVYKEIKKLGSVEDYYANLLSNLDSASQTRVVSVGTDASAVNQAAPDSSAQRGDVGKQGGARKDVVPSSVQSVSSGGSSSLDKHKVISEVLGMNSKALAIIENSIEPQLRYIIIKCKYAYEAVQAVEAYWNAKSPKHSGLLAEQLESLTFQQFNHSVKLLFAMRTIVEEMQKCGDTSISEQKLAQKFLDKLPQGPTYGDIRALDNVSTYLKKPLTTADLMDTLTSIELQRQIQALRQSGGESTESVQANAMVKQGASFKGNRKQQFSTGGSSSKYCTNCKKANHTAEECYWPGGGAEHKRPAHLIPRDKDQSHGIKKVKFSANVAQSAEDANFVSLVTHVMTLNAAIDSTALDNQNVWLSDGGCNKFVTCRKDWLYNYQDCSAVCTTIDNSTLVTVVGRGSIQFEMRNDQGKLTIATVEDVLYSPSFSFNLFPVGPVDDKKMYVVFGEGMKKIYQNGECIATGQKMSSGRFDGLYVMDIKVIWPKSHQSEGSDPKRHKSDDQSKSQADVVSLSASINAKTIHERLGHPSKGIVKKMV
ncbi:hypothetical protein MP228_010462 [Amoeboaphelidium protococcarum]|nr:hypothetical protein MP228_010462 [Amoeboaphelidium protococcarum]